MFEWLRQTFRTKGTRNLPGEPTEPESRGASAPTLPWMIRLGEYRGESPYGWIWRLEGDQHQLCLLAPHCVPFAPSFARIVAELSDQDADPRLVHRPWALVRVDASGAFQPGVTVEVAATDGVGLDPLARVALLEPAYETVLVTSPRPDPVAAFVQVAGSLAELHRVGKPHGAIGPNSVGMLQGRLVLVGAGLHYMVDVETNHRSAAASPGFADTRPDEPAPPFWTPPEVRFDGATCDQASADVYSVCVIGYGMACRRFPFAGLSTMETLRRSGADWASQDEYLAARSVPKKMRSALLAGLSRDPEARPPDGQALLALIEGRG